MISTYSYHNLSISYRDRFDDVVTCYMCKRFPIEAIVYPCEFTFHNKTHVLHRRCRKYFIPITEEEYKNRQNYKKLLEEKDRLNYRIRHREELKEKSRIYKTTHKEQILESKRIYYQKHKSKLCKENHERYEKNRESVKERKWFREQIRYYYPYRNVLDVLTWHRKKEENGPRVMTEEQKINRRKNYHENKNSKHNLEYKINYRLTHKDSIREKNVIRQIIYNYDPFYFIKEQFRSSDRYYKSKGISKLE